MVLRLSYFRLESDRGGLNGRRGGGVELNEQALDVASVGLFQTAQLVPA